MPRWSRVAPTTLAVFAVLLGGCLQKEKSKPIPKSWVAPWDSGQHAPRSLTDFHYEGPESLFTVFRKMEVADSLVLASKDTVKPENPTDTLRIYDLFDTGFVFPAQPEATRPYAYDDAYRDDTLFRKFYGGGLYEQENPCVETYVLSGEFLHPAKWLRAGMQEEDLIAALGVPQVKHPTQLRYLWHSKPEDKSEGDSLIHYESVRFYFEKDSLYAALLQQSKPCF